MRLFYSFSVWVVFAILVISFICWTVYDWHHPKVWISDGGGRIVMVAGGCGGGGGGGGYGGGGCGGDGGGGGGC